MPPYRVLPASVLTLALALASACSEDPPPPAAGPCEDLLRCCEGITGPEASQCHAVVTASRGLSSGGVACEGMLSTLEQAGSCRSAGIDGGVDAGESSRHGICDAYISCVGKTTPEGLGAVASAYGPNGTCWSAADESVCIEACRTGVRNVRKLFPDEAGCRECVASTDCADSAAGRVCETSTGRCVHCASDGDCSESKPACDLGKRECVGCTSKEHCKGGACDRSEGKCVACVSDADCAAPNPRCKKEPGSPPVCVACRGAGDCASGACSPDGTCCQPESCGEHKTLVAIGPKTWICGSVGSALCSGARIDCGTCTRGICTPFMGTESRCSLEGSPCTPGVPGTCQNDEACTYVAGNGGYVCTYDPSL